MEFKDVEEVITAGTVAIANDLLAKGWVLLTVVAGEKSPDFVLGRFKGTGPLQGKNDPLAGLTGADIARANRGL